MSFPPVAENWNSHWSLSPAVRTVEGGTVVVNDCQARLLLVSRIWPLEPSDGYKAASTQYPPMYPPGTSPPGAPAVAKAH